MSCLNIISVQAAPCRLVNPQHSVELGTRTQLKFDKEAAPNKIAFVLMEDYAPSSRPAASDDKHMRAVIIPARADKYLRF